MQNSNESKGTCVSEENVLPVHFTMASCDPLLGKESVCGDVTFISFENAYKLGSLNRNELSTLCSVYLTMYQNVREASLNLATLCKKYKSLSVGGERYGSTTGFRLCPYAHIIAAWCGDNGVINPGMHRPGIVRHFIIHSVEIEGKQIIYAFAVVNWLKPSEQDFRFGNPLSVWCAGDFEGHRRRKRGAGGALDPPIFLWSGRQPTAPHFCRIITVLFYHGHLIRT